MKLSNPVSMTFALALALSLSAAGCDSERASAPPANAIESEPRVWIARSDGSKSCETESGTDLRTDEGRLKDAGVPVFDSRKGDDGMMHIQMCGAETGKQNRYLIPASQLASAQRLGFEVVKE